MSHYGKIRNAEERIATAGVHTGFAMTETEDGGTVKTVPCGNTGEPKSGTAERYSNGKPVKRKCACRHRDCKYRSRGHDCVTGSCDYIAITGHSRLLWHRVRGLSEEVKDCKLYEKREKTAEATTSSTASGPPSPSLGKAMRGEAEVSPEEKAKSGKKPGRKRKDWRINVEMVRELNRRGLNDKQIAQVMGKYASNIFRVRKENGINNVNFRGGKSKVSDEEARRIYEEIYGHGEMSFQF